MKTPATRGFTLIELMIAMGYRPAGVDPTNAKTKAVALLEKATTHSETAHATTETEDGADAGHAAGQTSQSWEGPLQNLHLNVVLT